jgi:hypothetical protein
MRAYLEAIEAGKPGLLKTELEAKLTRVDLANLRENGLLRDDGREGIEEISLPDFARALRSLYGARGRGLSLPTVFDSMPATIGWAPHGKGERPVMLLIGPKVPWFLIPHYPGATLVLVPTGRQLTPAQREEHGPGATIEIEVLTEALAWRDGRLARGFAVAPPAADRSGPSLPPARRSGLLRGAPRWNVVVFSRVDDETVYVAFPGVSIECSHRDLGMTHARAGRPRRTFQLLVELCEGEGVFLSTRFGSANATKQLVSRLGAELRDLFGIDDPPFHPYRTKAGWQSRFQARSSRRGDD